MPFPLLRLNGDLRYRLRKISYPSEVYDFATAAPGFFGHKPVIKYVKLESDSLTVTTENPHDQKLYAGPSASPRYFSYLPDGLYELGPECSLILKYFNWPTGIPENLSHVGRIQSTQISFFRCLITPDLLEYVGYMSKVGTKQRVTFGQCKVYPNTTLDMICAAFPTPFCLHLPRMIMGSDWVSTLLERNMTGLRHIEMEPESIEFYDINPHDLIKFVNAQPDPFFLTIYIITTDNRTLDRIIEKMYLIFAKYFKLNVFSCPGNGRNICFRNHNIFSWNFSIRDTPDEETTMEDFKHGLMR